MKSSIMLSFHPIFVASKLGIPKHQNRSNHSTISSFWTKGWSNPFFVSTIWIFISTRKNFSTLIYPMKNEIHVSMNGLKREEISKFLVIELRWWWWWWRWNRIDLSIEHENIIFVYRKIRSRYSGGGWCLCHFSHT